MLSILTNMSPADLLLLRSTRTVTPRAKNSYTELETLTDLLTGTNAGDVEKLVPADALLLAGTCIVDEAVLTGESTPQWKSAIGTPEEDDLAAPGQGQEKQLSIKRDKNHVLFSGTKLLQHTGDKEAHIKTPDGACLAVVLRTGFETSQGILLRFIS